MVGLITHLQ